MADDSTVTVSFEADTSGLQSGIGQVNSMMEEINDSTSDTMELVDMFFSSMTTASDAAVKGILLGTQTWQQAMARAFSSVLAVFINDLVVNRVLGWAQSEIDMTADTASGNAARLADDETTGAADAAAQNLDKAAQLSSDAALAYGGVYAFLAPEMGPAAEGPAAAAEAQVMAMASLDVGAWNVPQNMPAYLHAGEMVVPADFASGLRGGGGMGGDNYTINVNAIDTQTGAQFLKNNASIIASTLSSQVRNFNKNVPAWKS